MAEKLTEHQKLANKEVEQRYLLKALKGLDKLLSGTLCAIDEHASDEYIEMVEAYKEAQDIRYLLLKDI